MSGARSRIDKVMDALANLGFVMRDTRREKVADAQRVYGPETDGFRLSVHSIEPAPTVSVAMKNVQPVERRATLPDWLFYYGVTLFDPDGSPVPLSAFGRQVLEAKGATHASEIVFPSREPVAAEIPLGALYDMRRAGVYRASVFAQSPVSEKTLQSNELAIYRKAS